MISHSLLCEFKIFKANATFYKIAIYTNPQYFPRCQLRNVQDLQSFEFISSKNNYICKALPESMDEDLNQRHIGIA